MKPEAETKELRLMSLNWYKTEVAELQRQHKYISKLIDDYSQKIKMLENRQTQKEQSEAKKAKRENGPIVAGLVVRAYSGELGCMCGCRGKYTEDPSSIKRIVGDMNELWNEADDANKGFSDDGLFAWLEYNRRNRVVYFRKL